MLQLVLQIVHQREVTLDLAVVDHEEEVDGWEAQNNLERFNELGRDHARPKVLERHRSENRIRHDFGLQDSTCAGFQESSKDNFNI